MRICILTGALAAFLGGAAAAQGEPVRGDGTLTDGTRQGFEAALADDGTLQGLSAYQQPISSPSAASGAILIYVPEEAGDKGASVHLRLSPLPSPGKEQRWDFLAQVQAAVKAGRLPAKLGSGTLMFQFLKGRKGHALGAPISAKWSRASRDPLEPPSEQLAEPDPLPEQ